MRDPDLTELPAESDVLASRDAGDKIIRGGSLRVGAYVLSMLVGLVSAPLLVRHLGVGDYGMYVTVGSIVFVIGGLAESGLSSVAVREYATADRVERHALLNSLSGLRLLLALGGYLVGAAFVIVADYPEVVVVGYLIAATCVIIGAQQTTLVLALQADLQLGRLSLVDLARQLATTILIVGLVAFGAGLLPFYLVAPVGLAASLAVTVHFSRGIRLRPSYERDRWVDMMRQTGVFAIATALAVMYFQVAIVATSLLADEHQAGLYGAAFRVVEIANGVPWLLAAAAFPLVAHAARNDAERMRYAQSRIFDTNLIVGSLFAVVVAIGAPVAMDVIGGDSLDDAIPVLRTLAIGVPFTFMLATWAYALLSMRMHRPLLLVNLVAVVLAIALSLLLIPSHGARGAGWVTAALEVTLAAGYLLCVVRADRELRPPLRGLVRVVPATAVALAAGLLAPVPAVPATILAVIVHATIVLATRALPEEIAAALRARSPYPRRR